MATIRLFQAQQVRTVGDLIAYLQELDPDTPVDSWAIYTPWNNARRKPAPEAQKQPTCRWCGRPVKAGTAACGRCREDRWKLGEWTV